MARPTDYKPSLADTICELIADGKSLREICKSDDMPNRATVFRWLNAHEEFSDQYARAREEQAETLADEIVGIADEECTMIKRSKHTSSSEDDDSEENEIEVVFDNAAVARNRLRMEARKWVASKLKPKKYGDKLDLNGNIDHNLTVEITRFSE
jgi:hypothetical protein